MEENVMRARSLVQFLTIAFVAAPLLAGCGAHSMATPPATPEMAPVQVPFAGDDAVGDVSPDLTATIGVRLTGENPFQSTHYGRVIGYFKGRTNRNSQVVMVSPNINISFVNVDSSLPHTASFLGKATQTHAPWPATFNGSSTASKAGTAIGTSRFSTGTINPGGHSLLYKSGVPGFYMIGCAFHYDSNGMRTVIIVK
jgi:plastocyanin